MLQLIVQIYKLLYTTILVTCSLILHTHNKFVTLWVNYIDNRQFHLWHLEKINQDILIRNTATRGRTLF